jgi:hypothetical protein
MGIVFILSMSCILSKLNKFLVKLKSYIITLNYKAKLLGTSRDFYKFNRESKNCYY